MNSSEKKDVIAIGNAMVDVVVKSNLDTIKSYGVNHDSMNLIDEEKKNQLHKEICTITWVSMLLRKPYFSVCRLDFFISL